MTITIDQAGRLVIPKSIRDRFNLRAGCELEIEASGNEIRLCVADLEPSLVKRRGMLIHHGTNKTDLDVVDFIRSEREKEAVAEVER
jgi:AbrB family looped-hinge helix DNA binding protein